MESPSARASSQADRSHHTISVIVPAYGPSPHLEAVLDGIALGGDQPNEILVSHSGDNDPTERLRKSHPNVTVLHSTERLLGGGARNRAMHQASSEILAFCDNDTLPDVNWLAIIRASLTGDGIFMVGAVDVARTGGYWGMGTWLCEFSEQAPWGGVREQAGGASCNMAVRREDIVAVGGFPEKFQPGEDTILFHNLRERGLRQIFDPALRVGHFNISGFAHFRRHLFTQGRHFAKSRTIAKMSGHTAVRLWPLAPALGLAKGALVTSRLAASKRPLFFLKHFPAIVVGMAVWTAGVTYAAATGRYTGTK